MSEAKSTPKGGGFQFKVRGPRDFYGGLALIALAIVALAASADLPGQSGFALLVEGPPVEKFAFRGPAYVLCGILLFAGMIRGVDLSVVKIPARIPSLGLVVATFTAFIVSIMGSTEMKWVESLIVAVGMTIFCVLLFVYALGLPFQLWPAF
jgi:putative tricarboxylic transport membrane protein